MLYNSSSPIGIIIIGVLMSITGIIFLIIGEIIPAILLLIGGCFFLSTIFILKKYYVSKSGIKQLFGPCQYDDSKNDK